MIDGVERRELDVNVDGRGRLVELQRSDWDIFDPAPEMAYYSVSEPEVIRAWHRHSEGQVDYFSCPIGRIRIGIYDDRPDSPTQGEVNDFVIGEHDQQVVRIPGDCWHGFKNVTDSESVLINFPTELYDYDNPDEERIPPDSEEIPLDWNEQLH